MAVRAIVLPLLPHRSGETKQQFLSRLGVGPVGYAALRSAFGASLLLPQHLERVRPRGPDGGQDDRQQRHSRQ